MRRFIVGLAGVAVTTLGLAAGLTWWAAALFHEVDEWYRSSSDTTVYSDEVSRYYASLQSTSYTLQGFGTPLAMGGVFAVLLLLAVLALRWERREAARP